MARLTGRAAFLFGFKVGRKTKRYWSPREATNAYPALGDVDCFLNGVEDGARNDRWRYDQLLALASVALVALGSSAHAQSYADDVCRELRAQRPGLVAPIAVTGHQPVTVHGKLTDQQSYWTCPARTASGANLPPVDAESYVPTEVRNVFQCEGVEPEDGCLARGGVSIGTHYSSK